MIYPAGAFTRLLSNTSAFRDPEHPVTRAMVVVLMSCGVHRLFSMDDVETLLQRVPLAFPGLAIPGKSGFPVIRFMAGSCKVEVDCEWLAGFAGIEVCGNPYEVPEMNYLEDIVSWRMLGLNWGLEMGITPAYNFMDPEYVSMIETEADGCLFFPKEELEGRFNNSLFFQPVSKRDSESAKRAAEKLIKRLPASLFDGFEQLAEVRINALKLLRNRPEVNKFDELALTEESLRKFNWHLEGLEVHLNTYDPDDRIDHLQYRFLMELAWMLANGWVFHDGECYQMDPAMEPDYPRIAELFPETATEGLAFLIERFKLHSVLHWFRNPEDAKGSLNDPITVLYPSC